MSKTTATTRASVLVEAARGARLAPSVHNTQPWSLLVQDDHLDLVADQDRRLNVLDPFGRELAISCGSALFNVRVVLEAWGYEAQVERMPDADNPDLLARVRIGDPISRPSQISYFEPLLELRRANRRQFAVGTVPDDVMDALQRIAHDEGSMLVPITDPDDRLTVARLTQEADRIQNSDAAYRAELRSWMTSDPTRLDGVPADAIPHIDGTATDDVPIRDFDTRGAGLLPPDTHSSRDQCLVLLCSEGNSSESWLRVGEALEHVWLEVTRRGLATSPITQVTEVPAVSNQLRRDLRLDVHPQMLLRIGRAAATPATPRREPDEVIRVISH